MAKNKTRPFAGIPNRVMDHPDFNALSANSVRLLLWFAYQYKGNNNGKLCAVHSQLRDMSIGTLIDPPICGVMDPL